MVCQVRKKKKTNDAPFLILIVHDARPRLGGLGGIAEDVRLLEQCVHQRRLAVIDVRDDRDVAIGVMNSPISITPMEGMEKKNGAQVVRTRAKIKGKGPSERTRSPLHRIASPSGGMSSSGGGQIPDIVCDKSIYLLSSPSPARLACHEMTHKNSPNVLGIEHPHFDGIRHGHVGHAQRRRPPAGCGSCRRESHHGWYHRRRI
jgi:hypothetical protein